MPTIGQYATALVEMENEEACEKCQTFFDGMAFFDGIMSLTIMSISEVPNCRGSFQLQDGTPSVMNCVQTAVNRFLTPDMAIRNACGAPAKVDRQLLMLKSKINFLCL